MRTTFVAGNWKMFTNAASARALAEGVVKALGDEKRVTVAVCPPFPYLGIVADVLRGSSVALGAQNCHHAKEGAFTGEISPLMLMDVGCKYVILGHSERRHILGESNEFINLKVHAALDAGLHVILCIGETLEQRQTGRMEAVLLSQLTGSLAGVKEEAFDRLILAYEPVWAIGTGVVASPEQAQTVHAYLRERIGRHYNPTLAANLVIQYGGSVKPDNAASLIAQPDVDGGLIGGASLKADQFLAIVKAGLPS